MFLKFLKSPLKNNPERTQKKGGEKNRFALPIEPHKDIQEKLIINLIDHTFLIAGHSIRV